MPKRKPRDEATGEDQTKGPSKKQPTAKRAGREAPGKANPSGSGAARGKAKEPDEAKPDTPIVALARQIDQEMREMERRVSALFADTAVDWKERFPLLTGWNLTPSASGMPNLERFGTLGTAVEGFLQGWRRPVIQHRVDEEDKRIVATVELPGVDKKDIHVEVRGDSIQVRAESGDRKYRGMIATGRSLQEDSAEATYTDGILTITVALSRPSDGKGHVVNVK